jgi:hypothetical protein
VLLYSPWEGGEKMGFLPLLELVSKIVSISVGAFTLYIGIRKIMKTRKSKIKRNASNDVPK